MTILVSDKPYTMKDKTPSKVKLEFLAQTFLNGGTATFLIKNQDAPSFSTVKSLTDTPELVRVPAQGFYKVITTGSAVVYGDVS
jgi:hypothetical protein